MSQPGRLAVLGLACRLPGAADRHEFLANLLAGRASLGPIPPERWDRVRHPAPTQAGLLPAVDRFDHNYFGITPREARLMDPQQRLLLEETVHCLEDAGIPLAALQAARTSVHVGMMALDYHQNVTTAGWTADGYATLGTYACILANRLSHVFGLTGESIAVDAACASSLLALHQARRALLADECDYALVAGINLIVNPWRHACFDAARMLSADGRCATFDAAANGYAPGEGVVVLLLRREAAALRDRQPLLGVILGTAAGHVGATHSITAPSIAAQRAVIEAAAQAAGVGLATIGYVEAHGTGTALGDPIELEALGQAFTASGAEPGACLVGSVKTNIGHLEGAAGLAGVAKALLTAQAGTVAPTLNLADSNPLIDFATSPFTPALAATPWAPRPGSDGRRRAGVSSFGFGGAVCHAIVEQAPERPAAVPRPTAPVPFLLSAHTPTALAALWQRWRAFAASDALAALDLADIAGTLAHGRRHLRHRVAIVIHDAADLRAALAAEPPVHHAAPHRLAVRLAADADAALLTAQADLAACGIVATPAAPAIDRAGLEGLRSALVIADAAEASALFARARALAASNFTFRAYLSDWQATLGGRADLAAWLQAPPAAPADRTLLVLVLVTALRRLHDKWQLPERHAALGPGWFQAAALIAAGTLPDRAAIDLIDGGAVDLPPAAPPPDIVVRLGAVTDAMPDGARHLAFDPADPDASRLAILTTLWAEGVPVDWSSVTGTYSTVALPLYPFEAHRHWLPLAPAADEAALLAAAHVIGGQEVVPAAAMLTQFLAGQRTFPAGLRDIAFHRPVAAADAPGLVRGQDGTALSLTLGEHVICTGRTAAVAELPPALPRVPTDAEADVAALYDRLAGLGHEYGPALRVVAAFAASAESAVGRLHAPAPSVAALIDGALQACLMAADRWGCCPTNGPYFPAAIAGMVLDAGLPEPATAVIRRDSVTADAQGFSANVVVFGSDNRPWLVIDGCRFARRRQAASVPPARPPTPAPDLLALVRDAVAAAVEVAPADIDPGAPFLELGVDSIVAAEVARSIGKTLGRRLSLHVFTDHPTPAALAAHLAPAAAVVAPVAPEAAPAAPDLLGLIRSAVADAIDVAPGEIDSTAGFLELGVDSIVAAEVARHIGRALDRRLPLHAFSDHPTPAALARYLAAGAGPPAPAIAPAPAAVTPPAEPGGIAIIGMAGRFPGAADLNAFWSLLHSGAAALSEAPASRWTDAEWRALVRDGAPHGARGGFLADAECFDAGFFGLSPREAIAMDPQQRVLLEEAWKALADAGLANPGNLPPGRRVGIFVGATAGDYAQKFALAGRPPDRPALVAQLASSLAARIAHVFDCHGPALTIDAACASAVAALQAACDALDRGEVDVALAAGVTVMSTPQMLGLAGAAGLLSASGQSRALTNAADGMLLGEGAGAVVLKRRADAAAAGDAVHAVIRAAVMNHDGSRIGLSTPSAPGQARLQRSALARAGLAPDAIGYVELHGVGTDGGDSTELAALHEVFGGRAVPIGSVKNHIGHTQSASGMASLFKVVLQMRHATLAPTEGLAAARPAPGADSVVAAACPWPGGADASPVRASVNVFALNGSNGVLVLEAAAAPALPPDPPGRPHLLLVTARSETALRTRLRDLATWLAGREVPLSALAATLAREPAMPWRAAAVASDAADLARQWHAAGSGADRALAVRIGQAQKRDPGAQAVLADLAARLVADAGSPAALLAAADLLVAGVDPPRVAAGAPRLTLLPPYPFERTRFWPDATPAEVKRQRTPPQPADPLAALRGCIAGVLRLPPDAIPADTSLVALGLDSLLAMELRDTVARRLGAELPVPVWLAAGSLTELAQALDQAPPGSAPAALHPDPSARHAPFPLTDLQFAYLVGRSPQLALGGPCQGYWEFEISAAWPLERLEGTFNALVACHDMLRAVIDDSGRQRVLADVPPVRIAAHDWRDRPAAAAAAALADLRETFAHDGFDPGSWPLFRLALSRAATSTRLHLSIDLLIVDVPSLLRLLGQWAARLADPAATITPPAISFRDCVLALQAQQDGPAWRAAQAYWQREANGLPPAPILPGQRALAPGALWRCTRHTARLDPAAWTALKAHAAAARVTPATAVLAAFAETLAHWAEDKRFTLNLTVVDRAALHPDVAAVIGDFTSTLLLGLDLAEPAGFAARAQAVQARLAVHLQHVQYGGVRVLRDLARSRQSPVLMPVVFTSMLGHGALDSLGQPVYGLTLTPQVWLDCHIREDAGALVANWDSRDGLFPDGLLAAIFAAFAAALRRVATPEGWQSALRPWLAAEQQARRATRNATARPVADALLHEALLRQAIAAPERVAVITPEGDCTYSALAGLAAAIAERLSPAVPDTLVAVAMGRSWEQIAAALGVLLAGAAYLPVDPSLPPARLHALLAQAEVATVLTTADLLAGWPAGLEIIAVDRLTKLPPPRALPPRRATPADLAYVIFTSGSTGTPKGVMIPHRAAWNTVADINARFGIGATDRVLALSALSFDLSVWDSFGVLGAGGAVVLPRAGSIADPAHLAALVRGHGVTLWNSVPSFVQLLLEGDPPADALASLRLVMMSGDWIPVALPERLRALCPQAVAIGLGGATEAAIWSVLHPIGPRDPAWPSIPYGTPLANQTCHVLDAAFDEVPDWVAGELYIGGAGVARGYWRDPVRTAERFLRHPRTGEALYRTGDLARYRDEAVLEFLGRADHQVKLAGMRVELGEIEAALARHPDIAAAVAVAPMDAAKRRRLVAFVVPAPGSAPPPEQITGFVRGLLPGYMVPAELHVVASLPRGSHGKIDRQALEARAAARQATPPATPIAAPATMAERVLAIWRAVLDNPTLPADGNLFEHGATSFAAVTASSRITRDCGACSVTDIFEFPTAQALAAHLSRAIAPPLPVAAIEPGPGADMLATRADRRRAFRAALQTEGADDGD